MMLVDVGVGVTGLIHHINVDGAVHGCWPRLSGFEARKDSAVRPLLSYAAGMFGMISIGVTKRSCDPS